MLPEIENHVGVGQVSLRVSLLTMEEVWELHWVVDEKDWSIVSNHVVVAFFGVEFDGEPSWVSNGVGETSLTCDSGESKEQWCLLADSIQKVGFGPLRYILGDFEDSMGSSTLGVNNSLRNSLSVEVGKLVNKSEILQQNRTSGSSSHRVLVVVNGVST